MLTQEKDKEFYIKKSSHLQKMHENKNIGEKLNERKLFYNKNIRTK